MVAPSSNFFHKFWKPDVTSSDFTTEKDIYNILVQKLQKL